MADNLRIYGISYTGVNGLKLTDTNGDEITYSKTEITADDVAQAIKPTGDVVLNVPYVYGYNQTGIRSYAFYGNNLITSITLNTYPNIYWYAFAGMKGLQSFSAPFIASFTNRGFSGSQYVFFGDSALTVIDTPLLADIPSCVFRECTALAGVSFPLVNTIRSYAFYRCYALTTIALPSLTNMPDDHVFASCTSLVSADLGSPAKLGSTYTFDGCTNFATLVLRNKETICELANINDFNNSCFADGKTGGTLYVPANMVSLYEAATNWSTILGYTNNQIKSIESTHTDPNAEIDLTTHYIDGTAIDQRTHITWSGSGVTMTSSVIDATQNDIYYTLPFVDGYPELLDGVTSESNAVKTRTILYSDAACETLVGYYYIDNQQIEQTGRTDAKSPWIQFDDKIKIIPHGYYAKLVLINVQNATFTSNAECHNYLRYYGDIITTE